MGCLNLSRVVRLGRVKELGFPHSSDQWRSQRSDPCIYHAIGRIGDDGLGWNTPLSELRVGGVALMALEAFRLRLQRRGLCMWAEFIYKYNSMVSGARYISLTFILFIAIMVYRTAHTDNIWEQGCVYHFNVNHGYNNRNKHTFIMNSTLPCHFSHFPRWRPLPTRWILFLFPQPTWRFLPATSLRTASESGSVGLSSSPPLTILTSLNKDVSFPSRALYQHGRSEPSPVTNMEAVRLQPLLCCLWLRGSLIRACAVRGVSCCACVDCSSGGQRSMNGARWRILCR